MASIVLLLTQILHPTISEFPSSSSIILTPSSSSPSFHYTHQQKSPRPDSFKISPLHEDPQDSRVMIDLF
ncbi:hypothetical protein ISN44_As01g001370 [Arabidopsis suecica]|uniref:Transmembrane protein n=2 Tax=Arabidopsis TaxID=3701 RepID=A0A178W2T2_ARATH|nr:hypothetical protein ISN44_As01g001370 [Arabidopsis suecica]OAP12011.1 hypothetical protein AXX17_AT1G01490 [Arabidopsis thaliana]